MAPCQTSGNKSKLHPMMREVAMINMRNRLVNKKKVMNIPPLIEMGYLSLILNKKSQF